MSTPEEMREEGEQRDRDLAGGWVPGASGAGGVFENEAELDAEMEAIKEALAKKGAKNRLT